MKSIDCRFQILGLFLKIVWVAFEIFLFIILIFFTLICLKNVFQTLCWFLLRLKWFRRKKTHLFNNVFVTWGNCGIGNHTLYRYFKTIKLKAVFFTTRQRKVIARVSGHKLHEQLPSVKKERKYVKKVKKKKFSSDDVTYVKNDTSLLPICFANNALVWYMCCNSYERKGKKKPMQHRF